MSPELYEAITERSGGACEAEIFVSDDFGWMRCGAPATEVHHLLPKSRGGRILDEFGETEHLIHLCKTDHMQAHARMYAEGMMIDGSVTWNKMTSRPEYRGTDPTLTQRYTPRPIDG